MPRLHRILVITGMHRSGTSLLAGVAASAGIDMGTRLLPPSKGNQRGHFEDLDFVRFHESCLDRREAGPLRPPPAGVPRFDDDEAREAGALLARRAGKPVWGWKDPRTSLFLEPWNGLLPDPFYLLVYRHPVEVALSLLRRGLDLEVQLDAWTAIRAWTISNRQLLAFRAALPERCLLWSIAGATDRLGAALDMAAARSGLPLGGRGLEERFAAGELRQGLLARGIEWRALLPEAMELFARLETAADLPGGDARRSSDAGSLVAARERELEEANEHLLAVALAATAGQGAAEVPARQRIAYSDLRLQIARQPDRMRQLEEMARQSRAQLELRNQELARVEATRGWRLLHGYWGAARRWRAFRRQGAWWLRRLSGTLPRLRPAEIVIGCVAENGPRHLAQARRLVRSLRCFGGSLAGARFLVCMVGDIASGARATLEREGAEVRIVECFDRRNHSANKLQFYAEALATGARGILLLDCDTVIVGDLLPRLIAGALQAKIADVGSVTQDAFVRLFRHFDLPLPSRRYRTTVHGEPTILYCNTGVVFLTRELAREFVPVWREWNARILGVLELLGDCAHHCHQASFSLAMAAHPIPFAEAPAALNFPLHLHPESPPEALLSADPLILHYHDEIDAAGCLLPCAYPRAQARIAAFNRRLGAATTDADGLEQAGAPRHAGAPQQAGGLQQAGAPRHAGGPQQAGGQQQAGAPQQADGARHAGSPAVR
jgi:hypothetical protein